MPEDTLTRLEKLLQIAEDQMTRKEFLAAFKEVIAYVKKIDENSSLEVMRAAQALQAIADKLKNDTGMTLEEMKKQVDSVFVGDRMAAMEGNMTKAHGEMMAAIEEKLASVKDGKDGKRGEQGKRGKDGSPDTGIEIADKLEALPEKDKLVIEAIKGLRKELDDLKKYQRTSGGTMAPSVLHWATHEKFPMNGVDTSVTLSQGVGAQGNAIIVRYQGQTLDMETHYTVSGNKVTLVGFTPSESTVISVTYWP